MAKLARPATLWAAWARVAAGSGMPGADGVSVAGFAQRLGPRLAALSTLLSADEYRPAPLRLVRAVRGGGQLRERGLPTVTDRVVQRAFLHAYADVLHGADAGVSFAYQRGRSWVDALRRARTYGAQGFNWVFRTDISRFFDSIDQSRLRTAVSTALGDSVLAELAHAWVTAPILTETGLRERPRGVPEGAPVSPALANLYLHAFDGTVDGRYGYLVRYADDLALFCDSLVTVAAGAEHLLAALSALGLQPNPDKTYISTFDAGFQMLGWVFRGDTGWPQQDRPGETHPLRTPSDGRAS